MKSNGGKENVPTLSNRPAILNFDDLQTFLLSAATLRSIHKNLGINETWPASSVVEWLQQEIDWSELGESYRKRCKTCLNAVVKKYHVFPSSFFFNDIERVGEHPLGGGGFADVYKGIAEDQPVCLKVLRVHTQGDPHRRKKMVEVHHNNPRPFRKIVEPVWIGLLPGGIDMDSTRSSERSSTSGRKHQSLWDQFLLGVPLDDER
ncbi:hypothetical protein V5O48_009234 [Marasmius crinis-equi]|uniref:Protein kinase domain-containing protein n=1 Tax=Marasmius crinis-equi TaxID=585013 RepID=A0ABR3FCC7_9AGAR